jgi:hypothetical protein
MFTVEAWLRNLAPFGMTQRRVSPEVTSMNCGREPPRNRYGKAPY